MAAPTELSAERMSQGPPLADWLEALSHDSPYERQQVPAQWSTAVPPLVAAVRRSLPFLKGPDRDGRVQAATALGSLAEQAHWALTTIRTALKEAALTDEDESVRAAAAHAVLQVGPQSASEVAALIDSLQDELEVVRFHAAIALGDLGHEARSAVAALTHAALWDEGPAVRVEAAVALWKIERKGPLVIPALIKALGEDNELICWIAADCLGRIGPEARGAVPALRQAAKRDFKAALVGQAVALALQRIEPS